MEYTEADKLVKQLAEGFDTLQDEYQKLFGQHQALERKLATAREQYNELAKLCGSGVVTTPPLSLASSPGRPDKTKLIHTAADILENRQDTISKDAATKVQAATTAADTLRQGLPRLRSTSADGVKIWSGPSADRPEAGSSIMPSISESPLEQDFTIEGKPSKLGCPFASMANKKLSSHAASVLSRYNHTGSGAPSTPISSVNRINGRESLAKKTDRRSSFVDPIKAEICGLSDHDEESPYSERAIKTHLEKQENAEVGVCPIRFLDQHSPEEVATYFERHKHELPRSHEVCVKRYQSNEKQIRELDAKYGNLVSMIQGLGAKHKGMLPTEPEEADTSNADDAKSADKVRKWASSVSAQASNGDRDDVDAEDRQPHFERPLREIRVGESPSRPWGIHVPAKYLEQTGSERSSRPAEVRSPPLGMPAVDAEVETQLEKAAQCPFGFDKTKIPAKQQGVEQSADPATNVTFMTEESLHIRDSNGKASRMVFTGPVFIGYSAEDAARILQQTGLRTK